MKRVLSMLRKQEDPTDFFLLQNNNKVLIITFGGINQGFGMSVPPFEFVRSLNDKDCDVVFLRDRKQAYYHLGVTGAGDNIAEVSSLLQKIKDTGKYDLVVTLGNSMGGYAALLFGSIIGASVCIGISPRTFLDQDSRRRHNDDRRDKEIKRLHELCNKNHSDIYLDLHRYFYAAESIDGNELPLSLIFYGDRDRLDGIHSRRMSDLKSFHVFGIKDAAHDAAQKMRDSGLLNQLIGELIRFAGDKDRETLLHSITKHSPGTVFPS